MQILPTFKDRRSKHSGSNVKFVQKCMRFESAAFVWNNRRLTPERRVSTFHLQRLLGVSIRLSSLFLCLRTGHVRCHTTPGTARRLLQHLTMCGLAGSWARIASVQARAGFTQTDTSSSINDPVAGTSCYFKHGCLAKRMFNLRTTQKHLVRGPRTSQKMQRR